MWGWGRPRRNLPEVNYADYSSEEENDFESPLVSPRRPVNTRQGSPVELAIPTLNDNVDEELEAVRQSLLNVGHTPTFRPEVPESLPEPEVVEEGFVAGTPSTTVAALPGPTPPAAVMPDLAPTPFETENAADDANALKENCGNLKLLQ